MDRNKYNRISQCKTTKDVWRVLDEITHERINKVEDSKVRILVNKYEMFKMKPNESIVEMFTRFTNVVNRPKGLGRRVSENKKVSKILRCLPPKWNSKVEAKNLNQLPLEELIGSLMTYEMKIARLEDEMQEKEGKKKSIALKVEKEKVIEDAKINNLEEDIALITKIVQKLMMNDKFAGITYKRRNYYKKEGPPKKERK